MTTILIIDDDAEILNSFATALEDEGYRVVTAPNGEAGLALAREYLPNLILTDINMPGTDGRFVLQQLREDAWLGGAQIVLMTGNPGIVSPRGGMELGADDFLLKPIEYEALLNCVRARLQRSKIEQNVENRIVATLQSDLRTTLPHEFFTPLSGIIGLLEVVRDQVSECPDLDVAEMLEEISNSSWRLHRTLKNYLRILELEGEAKQPLGTVGSTSSVLIETVAREAAARNGRIDDLRCDISPCDLAVPEEMLTSIVGELLQNACAYSQAGTPIEIRMSADAVLRVRDHGRGMEQAEIRQIGMFRQFGRKRFEQQGLGLGLALVLKQASRLSVKVDFESHPGAGTTVQIAFTKSLVSLAGTQPTIELGAS